MTATPGDRERSTLLVSSREAAKDSEDDNGD